MSDEKIRYPGFNGLGRTAAIWGVPYMAMLVVVVASMFTGVLVAFFVGPGGLLTGLTKTVPVVGSFMARPRLGAR